MLAPAVISRKCSRGYLYPKGDSAMFQDWRIELIQKLREILSEWPASIRLYLLVLCCAIAAALVYLLYVTIT